jgi:hypothetical protein
MTNDITVTMVSGRIAGALQFSTKRGCGLSDIDICFTVVVFGEAIHGMATLRWTGNRYARWGTVYDWLNGYTIDRLKSLLKTSDRIAGAVDDIERAVSEYAGTKVAVYQPTGYR